MINFHKWPSIDQLSSVIFRVKQALKNDYRSLTIPYKSKVKLDGTNAAVVIDSEGRSPAFRVAPSSSRPPTTTRGLPAGRRRSTGPPANRVPSS